MFLCSTAASILHPDIRPVLLVFYSWYPFIYVDIISKILCFGDAFFFFFSFSPLSNSSLLVSFLEEVLASGLHSRSKESSQVTSRSASRRWNGDGEVSRMVQLPLLRRCRLSPLTRGMLEKSLGFCVCCYNPHPGSLLIPELLAQTPRLPVMSWE